MNTAFTKDLYFTRLNQINPYFNNDILNVNKTENGLPILNYYNIRYIVIHKNYMTKEQLEFANNLLKATLKENPEVYDEDDLIVYKVKKEPLKSFMTLSDNWHDIEHWNNISTRWSSNNASIFVYSTENKNSTISFKVSNFDKQRTLQVYLNNDLIEKQIISSPIEIKMSLKFKMGDNIISFYNSDGCQRPSDISESNNDQRCLSFAFQNITINQ